MPPSDSPGRATAARAALEREMLAALTPAFAAFVRGVRADAVAALNAPVLLASGPKRRARLSDPFTLASVETRWQATISAMTVWVNEFLRTPETQVQDYLTGLAARLAWHDLPMEVFSSVREVLLQSQAAVWTQAETTAALSDALSLDTGAVTRTALDTVETSGFSFRSVMERLLRTEATAMFNVVQLGAVRDSGHGFKKWVAHHDKRTRPTHLEASGQVVPNAQDFLVGGYALAYPGDPKGPAHETASCRGVTVAADRPPG